MKDRRPDPAPKVFALYAALLLFLLGAAPLLLFGLLRSTAILLMSALFIAMMLCCALFAVSSLAVYTSDSKHPGFIKTAKRGAKLLLPLMMALSSLDKRHSSLLMLFAIRLNNKIVLSESQGVPPDGILILLPHCLQNASCTHKVTGFIENCQKCMGCKIGQIKELAESHGISAVEVVTGGTAARSILERRRPALILAVACERDLASGIAAARPIPTIGVLNSRPNGPCFHTDVCMTEFSEALETVLNPKRR